MNMRVHLKSPLIIALAVALLAALSGFAQIADHVYWNAWYRIVGAPAAPQFAIVSLDNGSAVQSASTEEQAQVVDRLLAGGAKRVFVDIPFDPAIDHNGDSKFRQVVSAGGPRVVLVRRAQADPSTGKGEFSREGFAVPSGVAIATSAWNVDFVGYFQSSAAQLTLDGKTTPTVAAVGAEIGGDPSRTIFPDFGVDPDSIATFWSEDLIAGRVPENAIAGKTIFVTRTNLALDTVVGYFGHRRVPAAKADIAGIAGETAGPALALGSLPWLLAFVALITFGRKLRKKRIRAALIAAFVAALGIVPFLLMEQRIVASPDLAIFAMLGYVPARMWQKWREHVTMTSSASGLPNIEALAAQGIQGSYDVVAASISHYEQMLASLPRELHGECARQIARRLSIAAGDSEVFDSDSGQFVWLTQPYSTDALVSQLEGLKALFAAPLLIEGFVLDTNIHFGLDRNAESAAMSRIRSAIVSSSEAQAKGKLYEEFGSKRLAESHWELSLHARIDEALRNGHIWLAYQAQYDFSANDVKSAEILIRWTDPERGAIPPDSFILQAERAGRIDTLTYWVLEQSILASATLTREAGPIQLSVNLSAWMVDQPDLASNVAEIARRHDFDCTRLTFEVTETFSMTNRELAKRNLAELRAMGFRLSIDDFGTGQSGLAYLAEIPSDELKLDRRFIQAILASSRDRTIVSKTIQLAHALGQEVVAEGVEDLATFEALRGLGCDIAQGYFVGRPVPFADFLAELKGQRSAAKV